MWSHYADQHRGICIGYSIPPGVTTGVHKVGYGGSRLIKASMVASMLAGNETARREVDEAVVLRKAESWRYEQEWRLIGRRGVQHSPLELEEVILGLKCDVAAKYIAMKVLENRPWQVTFYEMREQSGAFALSKNEVLYKDELFACFPRRHLSALELLTPLADN